MLTLTLMLCRMHPSHPQLAAHPAAGSSTARQGAARTLGTAAQQQRTWSSVAVHHGTAGTWLLYCTALYCTVLRFCAVQCCACAVAGLAWPLLPACFHTVAAAAVCGWLPYQSAGVGGFKAACSTQWRAACDRTLLLPWQHTCVSSLHLHHCSPGACYRCSHCCKRTPTAPLPLLLPGRWAASC